MRDVALYSGSANDITQPLDAIAVIRPAPLLDYGDAPISYPSRLAEDGARHTPVGPTLGPQRDSESMPSHQPLRIRMTAADKTTKMA